MPFRWACAYGEDRIGLWQAFEVAGVRQVMRWIPPGEFLMGSPKTEAGRSDDERQHRVVLTVGFWMADTLRISAHRGQPFRLMVDGIST
jgi:formylglycine-generating enzyme required for sulfatase activity